MRVNKSDEYLKSLSKFKRIRTDSRLIYPNEMSEMTEMTISDNHCSQQLGKDLLVLVLVFSRVDGFQRRQTIRETWGQEVRANDKSRLYFTVGLTKDTTVQQKVVDENEKFGDILQFSYYESYYNCTIKAVGLMRWTAVNCPFVKFMLKVDDDSLILIENLIDLKRTIEPNDMFGYLWQTASVRNGSDKWSINIQDYPLKFYPDYIGGPYLIHGRNVLSLYETVVNKCLPALPFEDVYITGIVANHIGIKRRKLESLLYLWDGCRPLELDYCYYKSNTIFWQHLDDHQLRILWQIYRKVDICPSDGGQRC